MNRSTLVITLDRIISDYGTDILKDGKRVLALFSDYCSDGHTEKNKLKIAYEFDVIGALSKAGNTSIEVSVACKKAIDLLMEKAFIDQNVATSIVCDIADVMKLQYDIGIGSEIPSEQNKAFSQASASQKKATVSSYASKDKKTVNTVAAKKSMSALCDSYEALLRLNTEFGFLMRRKINRMRKLAKKYDEIEFDIYCDACDAYIIEGDEAAARNLRALIDKNSKQCGKLVRRFYKCLPH